MLCYAADASFTLLMGTCSSHVLPSLLQPKGLRLAACIL